MARRNKAEERRIARERIQRLLELAQAATREDRLEDARRYGELAWRLKTSYQVPTPDDLRMRTCRRCKGYLLPGTTSRTRLRSGKLTTTCLACGHRMRRPISGTAPVPETATESGV